jgi:hypothetical protein
MDLASTVVSAAKALYAQCQHVVDNRDECGALALRVRMVVDVVQRLPADSAHARGHQEVLASVRATLENANALITKLCQRDKSVLGNVREFLTASQVANDLEQFTRCWRATWAC